MKRKVKIIFVPLKSLQEREFRLKKLDSPISTKGQA
jgi:hypothetical protein